MDPKHSDFHTFMLETSLFMELVKLDGTAA